MKLSTLLKFNNITIQCHDNPDADTIASGFALWKYFTENGKNVDLIYSGKFEIQKSNLTLMISRLSIPIKFAKEIKNKELLLTVDCQYGGGNVTRFEADNLAVIDHHQIYATLPELYEIRSSLGSCSTLVYDMLRRENFNINSDKNVATALYYGLYTDTSYLSEIYYPLDKDLRDEADYDKITFAMLKNSNITFEELVIAGEALTNYTYVSQYRYGIVEARPCDPNILGIISDMFLEVDAVDSCLVYSVLPFGVKFSTRSCIREINAGEMAKNIARGIGSGGGHMNKGGGFIQPDLLEDETIQDTLSTRLYSYYNDTEILYADEYVADLSEFKLCRRKHLPIGYVPISSVYPVGEKAVMRTIEGDLEIESSADTMLIIGARGDAYPCSLDVFKNFFIPSDENYVFKGDYAPHLINPLTGKKTRLLPNVKTCYASGEATIYVKPIKKPVKLFTAWDKETYMIGNPGDFLAIGLNSVKNIYILEKSVFFEAYTVERNK